MPSHLGTRLASYRAVPAMATTSLRSRSIRKKGEPIAPVLAFHLMNHFL
jgi:hypothetical protein